MIGVDLIGQIRRAYFEQHRSIKEIVRTLKVSRATVRKVIRSHKTEFKYTRGVQPTPKLGAWVEVLTEIIEKEATQNCVRPEFGGLGRRRRSLARHQRTGNTENHPGWRGFGGQCHTIEMIRVEIGNSSAPVILPARCHAVGTSGAIICWL
jgi:hypothetical protein